MNELTERLTLAAAGLLLALTLYFGAVKPAIGWIVLSFARVAGVAP